jgi:hypothetical protein
MFAQRMIEIWLSSGHNHCAVPTIGVLPHVQQTFYYIVACRPVARQRPARNRGMMISGGFAKQQLNKNRGTVFSAWSVSWCYKRDKLEAAVSGMESVGDWLSWELLSLRPETIWEPRVSGTSATERLYRGTAREEWDDSMCAIVTMIFRVCNSVRLS